MSTKNRWQKSYQRDMKYIETEDLFDEIYRRGKNEEMRKHLNSWDELMHCMRGGDGAYIAIGSQVRDYDGGIWEITDFVDGRAIAKHTSESLTKSFDVRCIDYVPPRDDD